MTNWDVLEVRESLSDIAERRSRETICEKFDSQIIQSKLEQGWTIVKQYKNGSALMEHSKKLGDSFEDEVWMIFYKMGFKILNRNNKFRLSYSKDSPNLTKQIDVVAIDDEVCLLIECKTTEILDNNHSWKTDLESIKGNMGGLFNELKTKYPNRKIRYIFATKNYAIGSQDMERMKDFKIANFDYDVITYYKDLVSHLGSAARYQLLGNLFSNTKINEMEQRVPAIQGKMGGLTYYSFSIEPERLLKIAYVLHRTNANRDAMPTYQRIIKKERLKGIRNFINNGGFFPNSLIVSIDTKGRDLKFERSSNNFDHSISKVGILYLPQIYQSAYIIDGQHRLYGYSDSHFSESNTIPVVAFVDLDKHVQVKMFMDINENQKAVPKSLRNTLNIDLLWDSNNLNDRRLSLMLYISQKLGEDTDSPLYGRVVTGENSITINRCITIEYLKEALNKSNFLNAYKKNNSIERYGVFERYGNQSNTKTAILLYPFLVKSLKTIANSCEDEWSKGSNGFLTINNFMYAIICVLNDIVNIVVKKNDIDVMDDWHELYDKCEPLILSLVDTIQDLDEETIIKIKTAKGGGAKNVSWRALQIALNSKNSDFINDELNKYIEEVGSDYNPESDDKLNIIQETLVQKIKEEIGNISQWHMQFVPEQQRSILISKKANENANREYQGITQLVDFWDFVDFDIIKSMIIYQNNWSAHFQSVFTDSNNRYTKTEFLTMISTLSSYRNKISRRDKITKSQFNEIVKIFNLFCGE